MAATTQVRLLVWTCDAMRKLPLFTQPRSAALAESQPADAYSRLSTTLSLAARPCRTHAISSDLRSLAAQGPASTGAGDCLGAPLGAANFCPPPWLGAQALGGRNERRPTDTGRRRRNVFVVSICWLQVHSGLLRPRKPVLLRLRDRLRARKSLARGQTSKDGAPNSRKLDTLPSLGSRG